MFSLAPRCQAADPVPLLINCLDGPFADNPDILARLADAYFELGAFDDCIGSLEHLIESNPDHKSQHAHLLHARALEQHGQTDRALDEYTTLGTNFSGPEAKCRHAELLLVFDRPEEARPLYEDILQGAKHAPPHVRKRQRERIETAERRLTAW